RARPPRPRGDQGRLRPRARALPDPRRAPPAGCGNAERRRAAATRARPCLDAAASSAVAGRALARARAARGRRLLPRRRRVERAGGALRAGGRAERAPRARLVEPCLRPRGRARRGRGRERRAAAARVGAPLVPGLLVPHPAIHAGFWPAITRRQSPPSLLPRLPALAASEYDLWLGACDPEARRRLLEGALPTDRGA